MPRRTAHFVVLFILACVSLRLARGLGGFDLPAVGEAVTARAAVNAAPLIPGTSAQIAAELTISPRFHIQSAFAKGRYIPARLSAKPADGITFGETQYQHARDIPSPPALGPGTISVYEGTVHFLVPITIAAEASPGSRTLELSLVTQACDDKGCYSKVTTPLKVAITIGKPGETSAPANAALFAAAARQQYAPAPPPDATTSGPSPSATAAPTGPGRVVQLLSNADQLAAIRDRPYTPRNSDENTHTLPAIFLFALLGGLILNIMPCVLPVIPLKALSFIQQAHGNQRLAMLHGLAFAAGIVSLFVGLAVALRVFGLFYGQQFQSPAFIVAMVLFVVALALSMLGVWTINPPQVVYQMDARINEAGRGTALPGGGPNAKGATLDNASHTVRKGGATPHPFLGSFGSGVMATLLATPCSAPFLGPVFAWALVRPAWLTAFMLAIVGVGMSLPYLLLAAFPQLLNRIPRAGRWSELLKQGLGIVMLGVAFYLLTRIPNTQLWPWALAAVVVTGLVCWAWGQIPSPLMDRGRIWTIRGIAVAAGLLLGLGVYRLAASTALRPVTDPSGTAFLPDQSHGEWLPFNIALLDEALKQGRPVVVDWTADWCINCRVLEVTVLDRDETQRAFLARNAVLLRADLSEDNPPASALNKKLGGEAIPVLAIFSPAHPTAPVVLRDSYGSARVIQELNSGAKP